MDIENAALKGIAKSHEEYTTWSAGCWLDEAPEYLITTNIAREIWRSFKQGHHYFLTLEEKVRNVCECAEGEIGNVDIALWDPVPAGTQRSCRAIIEVKKQISGFEHIRDDIQRICDLLQPIFNTASEYTLIINRLRRQNRASGTTNALKPVIWGGSDDHLADPSGSGIDAQGVVDGLLIGFGPRRLAHVQGPPVPSAAPGRDPIGNLAPRRFIDNGDMQHTIRQPGGGCIVLRFATQFACVGRKSRQQ